MCCRKICQYFFLHKKINPAPEISNSAKEKPIDKNEEPKSDKKKEFIEKILSPLSPETSFKDEIDHLNGSEKMKNKIILDTKVERNQISDITEEIPKKNILDPINKKLNESEKKGEEKINNDKDSIIRNQEIPLKSKSSSLSYAFDDSMI